MEYSKFSPAVRFGIYEADLTAGELRKNGLKVKLQGKPFEIMTVLLEHPGEVVSREQLHKRLWPADIFVDFDHGLNNAMNKLRYALGDSADNSRFILTEGARGYRFIAPVERIPSSHLRGLPRKTAWGSASVQHADPVSKFDEFSDHSGYGSCGQVPPFPARQRLGSDVVMLNRGSQLFAHHLEGTSTYDFSRPTTVSQTNLVYGIIEKKGICTVLSAKRGIGEADDAVFTVERGARLAFSVTMPNCGKFCDGSLR
jgi:DNA-binding winged helix-turn-helix (wHTH) protein